MLSFSFHVAKQPCNWKILSINDVSLTENEQTLSVTISSRRQIDTTEFSLIKWKLIIIWQALWHYQDGYVLSNLFKSLLIDKIVQLKNQLMKMLWKDPFPRLEVWKRSPKGQKHHWKSFILLRGKIFRILFKKC